jgi:hypothetical protein
MGVVAGQTAVLIDDTVKFALHEIIVTLGAEIGPGFEEERPVLRGVRIVAVHAPSVSGRLVGHRLRCGIVVTLNAQSGPGFDQKGAVGRSVGIMACVTPIILDDGM